MDDVRNQQGTIFWQVLSTHAKSFSRMLFEFKEIIDPTKIPRRRKYLEFYLLGFTDGEGCFSISVKKQEDTRFGWVVDPLFHVTQHKDSRVILELFKRVLGCGRIIEKPGQEDTVLQYVVDNRRHLVEKVIPFFKKNKPIAKGKDFQYFEQIVSSLEKGEHRNEEGLKKLIELAYQFSEERKRLLHEVIRSIDERMGASETIRQASD